MTTGDSPTPPPGWYADPHGADVWRYWDGTQWTDHVAPRTVATTPARAVESEQRWATWARWAFLAYVPISATSAVVGAVLYDEVYGGRLFEQNQSRDLFASQGLALATQLLALLGIGLTVVLAVWTYQAAKAAKSLGIPIRREPGWALAGWLVPIINLWFPPTTIRSFAPDRAQLRVVVEWWACYIVAGIALVAGTIAAGVSGLGASIPFLVIGVVGQIAFALLGLHVVRMVREIHEHLLEERHLAEA